MGCIALFCCVQELRNDAELQEGNLGWLKARMAVLIEICADSDAQRQGSTLCKLSTDFKGLLASLLEVCEAFFVVKQHLNLIVQNWTYIPQHQFIMFVLILCFSLFNLPG